ncbi:MAG: exonuclease domain-containing protein, partial [Pseudomonadota bacterium]
MSSLLSERFRGFYPVVVDIETGGFHHQTDAILELAAVPLTINSEGELCPTTTLHYHIEPFEGSRITPEALAFTGINPDSEL